MARYIGSKNKRMRKIGLDLGLRTNPLKTAKRLNILPGFHGRKGRRKVSDYGIQLLEKQKARIIYGVLERQFSRYFKKASKTPKGTGATLLSLLERRLDNVIYRMKFAPTRAAARQLVNHGNVRVNQKKVTIPSYSVNQGDIINLTAKALKIPYIAQIVKDKDKGLPAWLEKKSAVGKISRLPEREDINEEINEQLIVEYYSRQ